MPRSAQRRVILFFWPIRASSANQISIALPLTSDFAISAKRPRKFFKSLNRRFTLGVMARAGRELAIVHRPQLAAQRLLGDRDAELLPQPSHQIDQTPAHHAVDSRDRASLELRLQGRPMPVVEPGGLTGALPLISPSGPRSLNFTTQSRTICSPTPPIRAASVRDAPS